MYGYEFKFVCPKCAAVHYYRPKKCQSCKKLVILKRISNRKKKMNSQELRLEIDKNRLDEEWLGQPSMYHYWALEAANTQAKYDEAKSKLDLVKAETYKDIRDNPGDYSIEKTTESLLANYVTAHPDCIIATKKVNTARHEFEIAKAALSALDQRKRALSLMVELWIRDYYSDGTIPTTSEESKEFAKSQVRSKGRNALEKEDKDVDDWNQNQD